MKFHDEHGRRDREKSAKPNPQKGILKFIGKVFDFLRAAAQVIWLLCENTMRLITFVFSLFVKLLATPNAPIVTGILAFILVCFIAGGQWYEIGVWLGEMARLNGIAGIGAGVCGVLLGMAINVYQLSPELWKISKSVAKAYVALGIKVDESFEFKADTPEGKIQDWLTADHSILKSARLASYAVETVLVVGYLFLHINPFTMGLSSLIYAAQGIISLLLPERILHFVSSSISVLGAVSDKVYEQAEDDGFEHVEI